MSHFPPYGTLAHYLYTLDRERRMAPAFNADGHAILGHLKVAAQCRLHRIGSADQALTALWQLGLWELPSK